MGSKKQTAVDLLIEKVKSPGWDDMFIWHKEEVFKQLKEMEKQQIIDAYENGEDRSAEIYYNETYGN